MQECQSVQKKIKNFPRRRAITVAPVHPYRMAKSLQWTALTLRALRVKPTHEHSLIMMVAIKEIKKQTREHHRVIASHHHHGIAPVARSIILLRK